MIFLKYYVCFYVANILNNKNSLAAIWILYEHFYANISTEFSQKKATEHIEFFHCFTFKTAHLEKFLKSIAPAGLLVKCR